METRELRCVDCNTLLLTIEEDDGVMKRFTPSQKISMRGESHDETTSKVFWICPNCGRETFGWLTPKPDKSEYH